MHDITLKFNSKKEQQVLNIRIPASWNELTAEQLLEIILIQFIVEAGHLQKLQLLKVLQGIKWAILHDFNQVQRNEDAREFYDSLRVKTGTGYSMILISREADYSDTRWGQRLREYYGAFIILHQVKAGDYDALRQVIYKTKEITWPLHWSAKAGITQPKMSMSVNGITNEHIGW